ncbi:LOW QUALITY PROTEIN: sentrin-specific protease 5 [Alosa alosa]|uniref:LOW QUALITY PROTEIN: sentrin-specific protease 5 n=1 Tax=Alosa alosa TaxID=278164 RepID=UPI002015202D|nr:LOW QUALITY PROTEIN: sentrin-specific protease 5 [Alosa alosa]
MRCMFHRQHQAPRRKDSAENQRRTQSVENRRGAQKAKHVSRVSTLRGKRLRGHVRTYLSSLGSEAGLLTRQVHGAALLKQHCPGPQNLRRNGPQAEMRVPDHSSPDPDASPPASDPTAAQTPENGRSRRRRVPKTCDCCGPNSKTTVAGRGHTNDKTGSHTHPGVKKRGRRKKEESVAKVTTEMDMTVDMQEAEPKRDVQEGEGRGQDQCHAEGQPEGQAEDQSDDQAEGGVGVPHLHVSGAEMEADQQAANQAPALTPIQSHDQTASRSAPSEPTPPGLVNGTAESSEVEEPPLPSDGEMEVEAPPVAPAPAPDPLDHCVPPPMWDHHYCKRPPGLDPPTDSPPHTQTHTHPADSSHEGVVDLIHEYLEDFYEKYGSFIPLCETEIHDYLNKKYNTDLSDSRKLIHSEVAKYKAGLASVSMQHFKVSHNKHTLTLEDLSTLDHHNWVNDQVINMYGELIMEAASHKVHFFNSFFYRQLVAKGYEGVKRWTKKVDVFTKRLLLIPLHLEVHWSLITVDVTSKSVHFYDSQGIMFKYAVDNILRYLLAEAREKKQPGFQKGWKMLINKCIPQQKNDSDCGVFVLEYCKCLALKQPLQFSQEDMPKVRKRIYQELCEGKLKD